MTGKISISMAPGEGAREEAMRQVIQGDKRFVELQIRSDLPVDLRFSIETDCIEPFCIDGRDESYSNCMICGGTGKVNKLLNMELKEPADWVSSVLSGHLMEQTLAMREARQDACTVILGDLGDIAEAIRDASKSRAGKYLRGDELGHAIAGTHSRCKSFRKRSFLNGVPVFYIGDDSGFFDNVEEDEHKNKTGVWKDILELAHDYLCDGDMLGFRQRPAENEREVAAAAMLHKGIGDASMRILLKEYTLCFCPRGEYAKPIEELAGFGPKRCKQVEPMIRMIYRRH